MISIEHEITIARPSISRTTYVTLGQKKKVSGFSSPAWSPQTPPGPHFFSPFFPVHRAILWRLLSSHVGQS